MEKQNLTVQEAAEFLNVSEWTVYDMVRKKELPAFHIRRRIGIRREDLNKWIDSQVSPEETDAEVV
ncbi:helix-turn-helix domain-containing protein [Paenibacillus tarimensis]